MAQRRSAKFKKYMKCQRYIAHSGTFDTKSKVFNAISQWQRRSAKIKKQTKRQRYSAHSGAFDPKNRMVDTTSSWHSVDQDQNGNTENTNMISKMQQKPSARPKKYQNLVYCRLGESGFCYSPQRARALASTFQGTLRLNQRTSTSKQKL